jgi:tetratricopeptide (TPR) repeat protein
VSKPADITAGQGDAFDQVLKVAFELHNAGRHADAEAMCRVLMRINPRDGQLLFLLGMALQKLGRNGEALRCLEQAVEVQPQSARIFNGLGFVYQGLRDYARAVEHYQKAIELGMQSADTFYSMGNACYQLGDIEQATQSFAEAVKLKPQDVASWNNLGKCLADSGRLEESIQTYDRAMAIDPNYALARYGRALSLLASGRLPEGFREYNQWRYYCIERREFPQPIWQGEPIRGKTLFLHAEQGFGDAIQHVRHVRQARERVAKVILECRPELKTLFAHSACADEVIAFGEKIPPFDYFTSLVSLPGILGVTLPTIPNAVPYLKAGILKSGTGAPLPPAPAGHLKIGVAWAGSPTHHNNAARSMRLEELAPLLALPKATFYSLQKIRPAYDEAYFRTCSQLVDLNAQDFLETSAMVAEMDLVIAVDTAVAHLAGALAKPVWTLLPFSPDWRWFQNRADTPWYPTMRLFRQSQRNQWQPVVAEVVEELGRFNAP